MTHPLTDEMIDELAQFNSDLTGELVVNRDYDMRAAADWQLEQVIEWLNDNVGMLILDTESEVGARYLESLEKEFIQNFKQAMRPQEDN